VISILLLLLGRKGDGNIYRIASQLAWSFVSLGDSRPDLAMRASEINLVWLLGTCGKTVTILGLCMAGKYRVTFTIA
jgi:hypothetical protein